MLPPENILPSDLKRIILHKAKAVKEGRELTRPNHMNTVINLPLRSDKEKSIAANTIGGGIQHSDLESLTGTQGIALISGIWLTNFQKLRIPLYDEYFEKTSIKFYEEFAKKIKSQRIKPPPTGLS